MNEFTYEYSEELSSATDLDEYNGVFTEDLDELKAILTEFGY